MRGRVGVLVAVFALVGVASGCSLREVQLWFAINKHQAVGREQAKDLADLVNSKKATGGCDGNYTGTCVPDNATQVHCAGAPGEGPAVRGPLTIVGWDSFELDPDGDRSACDSPVGAFDVFGQQLGSIRLRGWSFDPDVAEPLQLITSTQGFVDRVIADGNRGDLAAALPWVGANHGFDLFAGGFDAGEAVPICVVAVNVGLGTNTTLGCKSITMREPMPFLADLGAPRGTRRDAVALLEGADITTRGVRLRGWAVNQDALSAVKDISFQLFSNGALVGTEFAQWHAIVDPELNALAGLADGVAASFDFVFPTPTAVDTVCIMPAYSCRAVNT